jgi:hypothetical protein
MLNIFIKSLILLNLDLIKEKFTLQYFCVENRHQILVKKAQIL